MPKFRVHIARDVSEYASIIIEADSQEAAEARVEERFVNPKADHDSYWSIVEDAHWDSGDETHDERVLDVEPVEDGQS